MEKIIVTGAGGFLASRFYNYYKDKFDIVPLTHGDLDITNENKVVETIKYIKPDYVLHTAAVADTGKCEEDKEASYNINIIGAVNIAKGCNITRAKLIHLSTEQIFNGNIEPGPYSESNKPVPNTTYGKHKLQAEEEIANILEDAWVLRLTWLFGFPERNCKVNPNIIMNVLSSIMKGKKIKMPVNEYRGMTYVYELLSNIYKIRDIPYGIYHTGSENNLSTYDTAEIVIRELGLSSRQSEILDKDEDRFKDLARDIRISNKKLQDSNIYFMKTEEAVKRCIQEFGYKLK